METKVKFKFEPVFRKPGDQDAVAFLNGILERADLPGNIRPIGQQILGDINLSNPIGLPKTFTPEQAESILIMAAEDPSSPVEIGELATPMDLREGQYRVTGRMVNVSLLVTLEVPTSIPNQPAWPSFAISPTGEQTYLFIQVA